MEDYFFFVPVSINILCTALVIWPTLHPTFELPLPNEVIITNHNMLFQYGEAYTILYQFARHL